jgi:HD-GYP domain-containing protein (c-di-GMP phosphodiesterase class II)
VVLDRAEAPGTTDAATFLSKVPLLQGLRSSHLAALAAATISKHVPQGEPLVQAGRPAPGLVVLRKGRANRAAGPLAAGDCLEEMAALDQRMAEDTVLATEPVECLVLPARAVYEAIRQDPELGIALLREASRYTPGAAGGEDVSEQLMRYAADVREAFREGERRQDALRRSVLGTVRGLVDMAEAKHPWSRGHAGRAAHAVRALAQRLGLSEDDVSHAALGGLLHDVGYVVLDAALFRREGPFDEAAQRQLQTHPAVGAHIIEHVDFLKPVVPFVLHHHERTDGRGYPQGLTGKAIPLAGRLMAAVELYEMLWARQADPLLVGRALRAESDQRLDRDVANALADMVESGWVPGG